jgi:transcription initiation factor TFIIB
MIDLKSKKKNVKIEFSNKCPECGSSNVKNDYQRAEVVCNKCGLVIREEIADHGPEWRAYDKDQYHKRARAGPPTNYSMHDKGLSTMIDWKNKDSYGKSIPYRNKAQLYRLRKWQRRTTISDGSERNLSYGLSELNKLCSQLSLPRSIREQAGLIFRKIVKKKITRGRGIESIVVATIYIVCRRAGIPRTLEELSNLSGLKRKNIGKTYRFIVRSLKLKMKVPTPLTYVSRFCSKLELSVKVKDKTFEILKEFIDTELLSGRGPVGIAAAAIYISTILCDEKRTQRQIAEVAGVTEVTIRNRYKEIAYKLNIEIDQ